MAKEIWRYVSGYEGLYMVSDKGRVKSLNYMNSGKESLMYTRTNKIGRVVVRFSKNGQYHYPTVHRLVAQAFIPNPENKPQVHHIDGDPTNNNVSNLMWVTPKEHSALHPERHKNAKDKCSNIVLQYTLDGVFVREWSSTREIQKELGYWNANIARACRTHKPYKGFIWRYKE